MSTPRIADTKPQVLELEPGDYACCTCGQSQNQPWCDGSHQGTGFAPTRLTVEEPKRYALCCCKHSAKMPLCDGTHKTVSPGPA